MTKITTWHSSIWFAQFGETDGATDAKPQLSGEGNTNQEAIDDLLEKSDLGNVPDDIAEAFQLDMAEKGIHHDHWCDEFGEWVRWHVERDFKTENEVCEGRR